MPQKDQAPLQPTAPFLGCFLKGCVTIFALMVVAGLALFWFYGLDSHHENRNSIRPLRGRNLIPPAATDITLHRDLLTHYATYTISERDLNAFLDERFAFNGRALDSYSERSRPDAKKIGKAIGHFGWVVTEETVVYSFAASNGGVSSYYHDPTTGRTYQVSEYW